MQSVSASSSDTTAPRATLPAALRLGPVDLTVRDLDRSVGWYQESLGLTLHDRAGDRAELGDGGDAVLVLHEDPQAGPAGRHAGLYHYALLFATREELARAALRLAASRTPIQGASDHGTHEAIYLPDPDGNGIELAADRPREQWPSWDEQFRGGPQPLDFTALLDTVAGQAPGPAVEPGLQVGHLHLHVGDVPAALAFYRDVIGFDVTADMGTAGFLSAGGYHHHLGVNVWRGRGVGPGRAHTAGLRHWHAVLPEAADVAAVRARAEANGAPVEDRPGGFLVLDPWKIPLLVTT
jgi:catechol 2,3-dioxygenase